MAIISISRGAYTRGKEIAEKTSEKLGYRCISREDLIRTSKEFNLPDINLIHAIEDTPSILDRFTHGKEKYIAYFRAALLNQLKADNIVYHGFVFHHFVKDFPHVLKVRIISEVGDRIAIVMERDNISRKQAIRFLKKIDEQRKKWSRMLYGIDLEDPKLYDLVLNIDRLQVKDAVEMICTLARLEQFHTTPQDKKALADTALAAEVEKFLIDVKPNAEVCLQDGFVYLITSTLPDQDSELVSRVGDIMKEIPALKGIKIVTEMNPDERAVCISNPSIKAARDKASIYFTEFG